MARRRVDPESLKTLPLVREFFAVAQASGKSFEKLGLEAGVTPETIIRWQRTTSPNLGSFVACIETLGYQLKLERKEVGEHHMSSVRKMGVSEGDTEQVRQHGEAEV